MDYFNAFWVGGLICALVQILLDKTKAASGPCYGPARLLRCCLEFSGLLPAIL